VSTNLELAVRLNELLPASAADWAAAMKDDEEVERRIEALRDLSWPDLEIVMVGSGGFGGTFHGAEGFREAWDDWLSPFETYSVEIEQVQETGDKVVVLVRHTATVVGSDAPLHGTAAGVMTFRDGRLARLEFNLDREAALRSAGIESQSS
jgi:ketosteroid isomerase-like protein